ncbi:hypothetical protein GXB81_27355, partial [Paraburkholderia sp. Ac-20336]|nr:hypothetical protein [Paraburkholderia sp. Ac-20336]
QAAPLPTAVAVFPVDVGGQHPQRVQTARAPRRAMPAGASAGLSNTVRARKLMHAGAPAALPGKASAAMTSAMASEAPLAMAAPVRASTQAAASAGGDQDWETF